MAGQAESPSSRLPLRWASRDPDPESRVRGPTECVVHLSLRSSRWRFLPFSPHRGRVLRRQPHGGRTGAGRRRPAWRRAMRRRSGATRRTSRGRSRSPAEAIRAGRLGRSHLPDDGDADRARARLRRPSRRLGGRGGGRGGGVAAAAAPAATQEHRFEVHGARPRDREDRCGGRRRRPRRRTRAITSSTAASPRTRRPPTASACTRPSARAASTPTTWTAGRSGRRTSACKMRMFMAFGEGVGPVLDAGRLILLFDHEGEGFLTMLDAATGTEMLAHAAHRRYQLGGAARGHPRRPQADRRQQPAQGARLRLRDREADLGGRRPGTEHHSASGAAPGSGAGDERLPQPAADGDPARAGGRPDRHRRHRLDGEPRPVVHARRRCSTKASCYFITDTGMVSAPRRGDRTAGVSAGAAAEAVQHQGVAGRCRGGKLYFPTEEGDVIVAKIGPTFDIVATNTLTDQSFIASPALADGDMYLRSRTHLFRISDKK